MVHFFKNICYSQAYWATPYILQNLNLSLRRRNAIIILAICWKCAGCLQGMLSILLKRPCGRLVEPNYLRFVVSLLKAIKPTVSQPPLLFHAVQLHPGHGAREKLRLTSEGVSWP